ncbi:alanine dehydrogenase [Sphingomonas sp.]|uniref:alanine dehydrogenase n=1 Tax=Sphingomonas sp. TaxID=28214 RepID=UPI000DB1DC12|nr:alanine dehydrogenase [Sphingomonas sp.]PZU11044.1 MAG: alanine dehydrogenase [Sphingomonas sp.]
MRIGIPKEIKTLESRVAATPGSILQLVQKGHQVFVETGAGHGVGIDDEAYRAAGAAIAADADTLFDQAELIVKVKEPQRAEVARLRPHHILFAYLHLAPDPDLTKGLMASGASCIAFETVLDRNGRLPLLAPMSQVAGRMAIDVGAVHLLRPFGGRGLLLGGAPGVGPAKVLILGGGVAGKHAAEIAIGHRADVTIMDISATRLEELDDIFGGRAKTVYSTPQSVRTAAFEADLVVGTVLIPGATAPHLLRRAELRSMKQGSVLVDVSIDQGGCFETSRPTTHDKPTFVVDDVVHYCVANMPGAAPLTSTYALEAATASYVMRLADHGIDAAFSADPGFAAGLNIRGGAIAHPAIKSVT